MGAGGRGPGTGGRGPGAGGRGPGAGGRGSGTGGEEGSLRSTPFQNASFNSLLQGVTPLFLALAAGSIALVA